MDDHSFQPIAPSLDLTEVEEEQEFLAEDKQTAEAYFHPAWAKVEQLFSDELASLTQAPDVSLPAEEYKIAGVANQRSATALLRILAKVKDAVDAIEQTPRSGKQGGK